VRLGAFVAVATAHAALFIGLATMRLTPTPTTEPETSIIFFMLPPSEPAQPPLPGKPPHPSVTRHARPQESQANPGPEAPEHAQTSAPVMIDWAKEAERAAARQIDADEAAARQAVAFSPHKKPPSSPGPPAPAQPQFGWSHASTHRIEPLPGGGIILNLRDRLCSHADTGLQARHT